MVRAGQRLQQQRIKKGLTLSDVSKGTKIKESFLLAIEKGEYQKLPSPSYAHGFVKNYAEFLGFSAKEILPIFKREFDEKTAYRVLPKGFTKEAEPVMRFRFRKTVLGFFLILFCFSGFLFYQYRSAFFAPTLTISSPKDGSTTSQDILITGKTEPTALVYVNDMLVAVSDDGSFSKTITLFSGRNTVVLRAVNKFGKERVIKRDIQVKPASAD